MDHVRIFASSFLPLAQSFYQGFGRAIVGGRRGIDDHIMLGSSVSTRVKVIQALELQRLHSERLQSSRLFWLTDQG
jgi:hypothetical protein